MQLNERGADEPVKMQIGEAVKVDEFKNLGSAAKGRGRCTREVTSIGRMIVGPALMTKRQEVQDGQEWK